MSKSSEHNLRTTDMKPNPNVLFKRLGDEMVLFHLDTDHFYELNGTAARFWELLSEARDADLARERMLKEFAVDAHQLAGEVKAFITSLEHENLVSLDE
jgi:Coenzyme PQQ synthesis protein D (PqqD)